jgi:hypothetical protein
MTDPVLIPELRSALVSGIRERPKRRRRSVAAIATGVAAVALVLALVLAGAERSPALAIDRGSAWITLRISDPGATAAEMNEALHDAGLDAEVRLAPEVTSSRAWRAIQQDAVDGGRGPIGTDQLIRQGKIQIDASGLELRISREPLATDGLGHLVLYVGPALDGQLRARPDQSLSR